MKYHLIQLITVVLFSIILFFLEKVVARRMQIKMEATLNIWSKVVLNSLRKPLHFFIWFTVLVFSLSLLQQMFIQDEMLEPLFSTVYRGGVFFIFMWAVFRLINQFERLSSFVENKKYNVIRVAQFFRISAFVVGGICFLQFLDVPLSGLLAFGGIGGIALGFAAKDLFANFFGGFMIFLDQPFQLGDWIRSPNQEIEGTVEHIGWRLTRIRTPNKSCICVPNAVFSAVVIDNVSQMSHRQIKTKLTLNYMEASKTLQLILKIQEYLKGHPEVDKTIPFFAYLIGFSSLGIEVVVQAYTKTTDLLEYQTIQQEILLGILTIVESHGAHFARCGYLYPT